MGFKREIGCVICNYFFEAQKFTVFNVCSRFALYLSAALQGYHFNRG